jgi:homoserine acetyltransferase
MHKTFFLHGLDSSSKGTKGQWFAKHFPEIIVPDFEGNLATRLTALKKLSHDYDNKIFIGSSFGGLMATCFAMEYPDRCKSLILLAPALNFPEYSPPQKKIMTPATLIIGNQDTVTPPDSVLPLAGDSFARLQILRYEDDHMLHQSFEKLDWKMLLQLKP